MSRTQEPHYTPAQAAKALGLSVAAVTQLALEGDLHCVVSGGATRFPRSSLLRFVAQAETAEAHTGSSDGFAEAGTPISSVASSPSSSEPDLTGVRLPAGRKRKTPPRRRANGEGSARQRTDGRWEVKFFVTDPMSGERKRKSVYGRRRSDAMDAMNVVVARAEKGATLKDSTISVGTWIERWTRVVLPSLPISENYRDQQRSLSRSYLLDGPLARQRLDLLRPSAVQAFIGDLQARTKATKSADVGTERRALSESTVRSIYLVLRKALDAAVTDGLIATNPAVSVKSPRVSRQAVERLDPETVTRLLVELRKTRYYVAYAMIAATGLRRGELLGLRWADVDLERRVASIHGTLSAATGGPRESSPKSAHSFRQVIFPETVAELLRAWRRQQDAERRVAGGLWQGSGKVFTTATGGPVDPRGFLRMFQNTANRIGLPSGVAIHTLRHSAAVAMLEAGVHVKAVSDALGHSSSQVTLDIYGYTADRVARAAADGLSEAFGLGPLPSPTALDDSKPDES